MARKRLAIQMAMGIDQHGQDPTVAAKRAVRNAIAHNALPGVWEVAGLDHPLRVEHFKNCPALSPSPPLSPSPKNGRGGCRTGVSGSPSPSLGEGAGG
jgi:hypothetical protein